MDQNKLEYNKAILAEILRLVDENVVSYEFYKIRRDLLLAHLSCSSSYEVRPITTEF